MAAIDPKGDLLRKMVPFVLENGLGAASLRPLAKAADTSDRMLIYHFGSKDALMSALLTTLAADLAEGLDAALPPEVTQAKPLATALIDMAERDPMRAYLRVWLEIVARAGLGDPSFGAAGHAMLAGFLDWTTARLGGDRDKAAALLMLVEGAMVLQAVGHSQAARDGLGQIWGDG